MNETDIVVSHRMRMDCVTRAVIRPSARTMDERERIASSIIRSLCTGESAGGCMDKIVKTKRWKSIVKAAKGGDHLFSAAFTEIFDIVTSDDDIDGRMESLNASMNEHEDIMGLIEAIFPGDFEMSSGHIYNRLFAAGNTAKLKDDLEWIDEIVSYFASELAANPAPDSRSKRNVMMIADTSKTMFGEPEIISKAVILAISKRMLSQGRDVELTVMTSDGARTRRMDDDDAFIELITYRFGRGSVFDAAVGHALDRMRGDAWSDVDIVMISKGDGVRNGLRLAREWETFRRLSGARVFSVSAGGDDVKGLTELSDFIYALNDDSIRNMNGQYSKLIHDIG